MKKMILLIVISILMFSFGNVYAEIALCNKEVVNDYE